jgi:hypothetical protein
VSAGERVYPRNEGKHDPHRTERDPPVQTVAVLYRQRRADFAPVLRRARPRVRGDMAGAGGGGSRQRIIRGKERSAFAD